MIEEGEQGYPEKVASITFDKVTGIVSVWAKDESLKIKLQPSNSEQTDISSDLAGFNWPLPAFINLNDKDLPSEWHDAPERDRFIIRDAIVR